MKRRFGEGVFLILAAAIWWPSLHLLGQTTVKRPANDLDPIALPMARSLEETWKQVSPDHKEIAPMRRLNPEWDFMGRTFFILGEANLALRLPERKSKCLEAIDLLLTDTLSMEKEHGMEHFLMDYHRNQPWIHQPPRSVFIDGEIALCLGARRLVQDNPKWKLEFQKRIKQIHTQMSKGPVLCAESYPDECWIFCNTIALAAIRMSEVLDGENHSAFKTKWLKTAKEKLIDADSQLLISAFELDGTPHPAGPGAEGSSIWLATHMLQVIDPEFAQQQYDLAKKHLARSFLGFAYSREWTKSAPMSMDIDSGPIIPGLGASASASGLALVASAAFDDHRYYKSLRGALQLAAFPQHEKSKDTLSFLMAGAIGDPVIFYSAVEGPLWQRLKPNQKR